MSDIDWIQNANAAVLREEVNRLTRELDEAWAELERDDCRNPHHYDPTDEIKRYKAESARLREALRRAFATCGRCGARFGEAYGCAHCELVTTALGEGTP